MTTQRKRVHATTRKPTANRMLAMRIAAELFTNGNGNVAKRLVLELEDGRNGGGWAITAAVDRIEKLIGEHDLRKPSDKVK